MLLLSLLEKTFIDIIIVNKLANSPLPQCIIIMVCTVIGNNNNSSYDRFPSGTICFLSEHNGASKIFEGQEASPLQDPEGPLHAHISTELKRPCVSPCV